MRLLPHLTEHYKTNVDSLISKVFGVFTVDIEGMGKVHLQLMENTLRIRERDNLRYIFDLKGSLVDRKVSGKTKNSTTLKDVNFDMANQKIANFTRMSKETSTRLRIAMKRDADFLASHNLMDYSLLLGIENAPLKDRYHQTGEDFDRQRFSMV